TGAAVNGICKPPIFANNLKQPRTHILSKNRVQEAQCITTVIVAGASADAQRKLGLFGSFAEQRQLWRFLFYSHQQPGRPGTVYDPAGISPHRFIDLALFDIPRGYNQSTAADVMAAKVADQIVALH